MAINNGNNFHGMKPYQPIKSGKETNVQQQKELVVDREAVFKSIKNMWQPIVDYFKDPSSIPTTTDKMPEQITEEINGYMNISSNIATIMNSSNKNGSFDAYI